MIGPMKKKVITSAVVTAVILIIIFVVVGFFYVTNTSKKITELEKKGEVVQRYVFAGDMLQGDVITASDVILVDVKGESAPSDSYTVLSDMIGRVLKVNANARTIAASSLFYEKDENPAIDTRAQEYNMITLPSNLKVGDYIDVRLRFPTGEDYLVLVGEKVYSFGADEKESNTIFLRLDEDEILRMSSAIIESYIRDGVYLYANKYIDPDAQLFTYDRVNFVARYEDAKFVPQEEKEVISGEEIIEVEPKERTVAEIAAIIGLNIEETNNIKVALANNDTTTLDYYKNKLVVGEKSIKENYPVKIEVANLIKSNPNIISEVKAKYNVEQLEQQRINFLDTNLTEVDAYTGELVIKDEYISNINTKLQNEITTQKSERQKYLLKLLQSSTN